MTLEARTRPERSVESVAAMLGIGSLEAALGVGPVSIRPGRAVFEAPLGPGSLRPDGRVEPVLLSVMADCAAGVPVFTREEGHESGVTVEVRVDHVAAPAAGAPRLLAEGVALRVGRDGGQGAVTVRIEYSTVIAVAVAVMARPAAAGGMSRSPATGPPSVALPLDVLGPDAAESGRPESGMLARVASSLALTNSFGAMHGGVVMAVAQAQQERFLRAEGRADRHSSIAVEYLRPAMGGGLTVWTCALRRKRPLPLAEHGGADRRGRRTGPRPRHHVVGRARLTVSLRLVIV